MYASENLLERNISEFMYDLNLAREDFINISEFSVKGGVGGNASNI
jgi:hypothetical protein